EHYGRTTSLTLPHFASVPYAAPEQIRQEGTYHASDFYSFGATAAALIAGRLPQAPLVGEELENLLEDVSQRVDERESGGVATSLIKDLLSEDPQRRPLPQTICRTLDSLIL